MEAADKNCLECNKTLKGRVDKKFCSDLCRNSYNNKLNSDTNSYVRNINNILRKNRRILEETLPATEEMAKSTGKKCSKKGFSSNTSRTLIPIKKATCTISATNTVTCY